MVDLVAQELAQSLAVRALVVGALSVGLATEYVFQQTELRPKRTHRLTLQILVLGLLAIFTAMLALQFSKQL